MESLCGRRIFEIVLQIGEIHQSTGPHVLVFIVAGRHVGKIIGQFFVVLGGAAQKLLPKFPHARSIHRRLAADYIKTVIHSSKGAEIIGFGPQSRVFCFAPLPGHTCQPHGTGYEK